MNALDKYLTPEDHLQMQVCNYLRYQYPKCVIHHSPNEGKRGHVQQHKIKALGVSAGFPDLLIIWKGKMIALELKAGKNKPTTHQLAWLDILRTAGIPADWCTGFEAAKKFIDDAYRSVDIR